MHMGSHGSSLIAVWSVMLSPCKGSKALDFSVSVIRVVTHSKGSSTMKNTNY